MQEPNPLKTKLLSIHTTLNTAAMRAKLLSDPEFLQQCKIMAESGWQRYFKNFPELALFKPTADPIENYFMRLCLFKLIAEVSLEKNSNLNVDWFQRARDTLDAQLNQLIPNRQIAAGNAPAFVTRAKWGAVAICIGSATFFKRFAQRYAPEAWEPLAEKLLSCFALLMLASFLGCMVLESTYRMPATADVARELSRQQALKDLMNNPDVKALSLVSDEDLKKLGVVSAEKLTPSKGN
ncbi:MAG TPA: hypothetical protein VGV92_03145 [Gammaproteobacteria bacterium]|nr:hypothetical protein [Gammaproteobacteria bacterium]